MVAARWVVRGVGALASAGVTAAGMLGAVSVQDALRQPGGGGLPSVAVGPPGGPGGPAPAGSPTAASSPSASASASSPPPLGVLAGGPGLVGLFTRSAVPPSVSASSPLPAASPTAAPTVTATATATATATVTAVPCAVRIKALDASACLDALGLPAKK